MAYDIANAQEDYIDISLDVFGESVVYIPQTGSSKTILAIRYRWTNTQTDLKGTAYSQARKKIEVGISAKNSNGITNVQVNVDKIKMKAEPGDAHDKYFTICSAQHEYGAWRLGLIA